MGVLICYTSISCILLVFAYYPLMTSSLSVFLKMIKLLLSVTFNSITHMYVCVYVDM